MIGGSPKEFSNEQSMTPLDYYHEQCRLQSITPDEQQLGVLQEMEVVYKNLMAEYQRRSSFFAKFRKRHLVQGLYLWGGVGIGKTFLMDCFYQCIPLEEKQRQHFHQFMRMVHQQLKQHEGEKDPLFIMAREIASRCQLLCFDELFVSDITDAMLLGRLFKALFMHGVCLVTTSNCAPDDLYKRGLQREQFLPAIALIKQHTKVLHLTTSIDYRLLHLKESGMSYIPHNADAMRKMEEVFQKLTYGMEISTDPIRVNDREIIVHKRAGNVVWFDFSNICRVPRSQQDFLVIAETYRTIFISDIPIIAPNAKDVISLFIRLIDVLYDARVRLIFSSADEIDKLYHQGFLNFEYTRAQSRLKEMMSEDYFSDLDDNGLNK